MTDRTDRKPLDSAASKAILPDGNDTQSSWQNLFFLMIALCLPASLPASDLSKLKSLSLEQLGNIEITIAGKAPQKQEEIPAAVHVISRQQILNSGATSIPEKGSTFTFSFTAEPSSTEVIAKNGPATLEGRRFLIVDDLEENRELLIEQLQKWKCQIDMASSASEALQLAITASQNQQPYDVALIDFNMPEMDGKELTQTLKKLSATRDTKIIIISADCSLSISDIRQAGAVTLLPNPIEQATLERSLGEVFGRQADEVSLGSLESAQSREEAEFRNQSVLLAEDNEVNQEVARDILETMGIKVDIASNGAEAVEMAQHQTYLLILMDIHMPIMDGLKATTRIREIDAQNGTHTHIVALTANAMQGDRERFLAAGMDNYLSKPFKQQMLKELLLHQVIAKSLDSSPDPGPTAHEVAPPPLLSGDQDFNIPAEPEQNKDEDSAMPEQAALDPETMAQLREFYRDERAVKLERLINIYRETSAESLTDLQRGVGEDNAAAIASAAHKMKSSSGNLGALKLASMLEVMEQNARSEQLLDAAAELAQINQEYQSVLAELDLICQDLVVHA